MSSARTSTPNSAPSTFQQGRHRVHIGHLVMGLAFLCFTAAWALVQTDVVVGDDIRWLLPLPWLVAGAAGLVAVATGSLRRPTVPPVPQAGWAGPTPTSETDPTTATEIALSPEENR